MSKTATQKKLLSGFQRSLQDTVVLLVELKNKSGVTRIEEREIDDTVRKMQDIICSLPELVQSRDSFQIVFGTILKAIGVWRRLFAKDG